MKRQKPNDTIAKLNQLYVSTRRKYIIQTALGYSTLNKDKSPNVWALNDYMLDRHIEGVNTYGIFNANTVNKFITFDIDFADNRDMARWATYKIIDVLENEFHISRKDIHVSFSGNKGYHVDLFFDKAVKLADAKSFYQAVLMAADLESTNVEFRPTFTQAVKIPLGIHKKTGARCWFVDNVTLEPIESFDYLNDVEPMDHSIILDALIEITPEQLAEFDKVRERTNVEITVVTESQAFSKVSAILTAGQLIRSNTRHETTVLLAAFSNSQGYEQDEAIELILGVLHATPVDYFSEGSKPEFWERETRRIVKLAFDNDYKLGNADRRVTIYKSEILAVLSVGTFRQKQLAYAMLVTSKRYGETFYLTMSTAMKMIGTKARDTVNSAIKKLVAVGFIEYARKGEIDKARSRESGHPIYKPNRYRILTGKPSADEQGIEVTGEQSLVEVSYLLLTEKELRRVVSRKEFTGRWGRC